MMSVRKFLRGDGGNVAVMLGVSIMPVALAIGGAVDYSIKSQAQAHIQGALDAAVLAGAVEGIPDNSREVPHGGSVQRQYHRTPA